ncbi:MAG TPA: insulinase family protein [Chlorobiota bacterium]|nr:insulinase family protein [Chlorobiota bacterium]
MTNMTLRKVRHYVALVVAVITATTFLSAGGGDKIPLNSAVKHGKLSNGTAFYIMRNTKPEKRVEMVLAVNAGAVLEDADQNGLAHFCEHMAFNGTKTFPKQELINFLESTGVRFGADLNAYTNQDETVYMLTIPTDNGQNVIKGMQVLRDWASAVSYDDKEIEAERGVVVEEWRLGRNADERVREVHNKVIFAGSKYAERDVIGDTNVLLRAPADNLRRFYRTWYHPQNMAVIVVGDIDPDDAQALLEKHFVSRTATAGSPPQRPSYPVPPIQETRVSIATDKELDVPSVEITHIAPGRRLITEDDYRMSVIARLHQQMFGMRVAEITRKPSAPFTVAYTYNAGFPRDMRQFVLGARGNDKNIMKALNGLLTEVERVKRHGYTATELQRAKDAMLAQIEAMSHEADKTPSQQHAMEFVRHFLNDEASPGIKAEYELTKKLLATIEAADVSKWVAAEASNPHRIIALSIPEGNGYAVPKEGDVKNLISAVTSKQIDPWVDQTIDKPLLAEAPKAGSITKREPIAEIGGEVWTLSNGARVYLKPTDFKNDEILFSAWSWGGTSLGETKDIVTLQLAATMVDAGGLGEFDGTQLGKLLQGKNISISPSASTETFQMNGSTTPKDLKSFMEVLYLQFTAPRLDKEAITAMKQQTKSELANKDKNPDRVFFETVMYEMTDRHPRSKPLSADMIDSFDENKAFSFVKDAVSNAADYTFTFVGSFKLDEIRPLIETYIGGLPGKTPSTRKWKDVGVRTKTGKLEKTITAGSEPKSTVLLAWTGPMKFTSKNRYDMIALTEVMNIRLREQLREEKGGVYFVAVNPQIERIPVEEYGLMVFFSCKPERVDELVSAVQKEVDYLQNNTVDASYVSKIREIQVKERETGMKTNNFWLTNIRFLVQNEQPWSAIAERDALIKGLSAEQIRSAAKTYLGTKNFAKFVLKPE